jgi:hypothetical protein
MRLTVFLALVFLSSSVISFASFAAEETPLVALDNQTKTLLEGLDDAQKNEFAAIRNSHGIIRAVEDVQASVQRGVLACGKANADLKDSLDERLSNWRAAIRPVMKQAQTKQEKMSEPTPINESGSRVNLGILWTILWRSKNGSEEIWGGADYRIFASGRGDDRARMYN